MSVDGQVVAKVRAYMEALSPQARGLLVRTMQAAAAKGESSIPPKVLLAALAEIEAEAARAAAAPPAPAAPREPQKAEPAAPWRARFDAACLAPLEPIAVSVDLPVKQPGRVGRDALKAIWTWILRDVAPRHYAEVHALETADPPVEPAAAARRFRKEATPLVLEALRTAEADPKAWAKLVGQIGGEQVARDVRDVVYALQRDAQFTGFLAQSPKQIGAAEAADPIFLALVRSVIDQGVIAPAFVGALVLSRAPNPVACVGLAIRLTGTADPKLIAGGRYRELVDLAVSELEVQAARAAALAADRRGRSDAVGVVRLFHESLRQIRLACEIETVPAWFKRIGGARKAISETVGQEIEPAPGLVRRAMRVESLAGDFGGGFDQDALDDALFAVRLYVEARAAADSLALNDLLTRLRRQVEQTVEVVSGRLMTDLKSNRAFDRTSLLAAVDGAIRLSALVFGEDYAVHMRKSRDLALQGRGRATG